MAPRDTQNHALHTMEADEAINAAHFSQIVNAFRKVQSDTFKARCSMEEPNSDRACRPPKRECER